MKGRITRRHRRVAFYLLMVAYATFAVTGCGADRLVLGENHELLDLAGARRRVVKVDGRDVECWVTRSPGARARGQAPRAVVLYFTGKGNLAQRWIGAVAESWGDRPVEMWAMNYPGSGGSEGGARLARVGPSALAVYDVVHAAAAGRPVFVQGDSFGTAAALHVAARRPVAGVLLKNPPPLRQVILGAYGWWNLWLIAGPVALAIPSDLDSLANAVRCTAPALVLSAGADGKVPARFHRMVIDAYAGPKRVVEMPQAGHDDGLTSEAAAAWAAGLDELWKSAGLSSESQTRP